MSHTCGKLCSLLILEHFGPSIQKIHDELVWGSKTLNLITAAIDLPLGIIRKGLCILVQYGFVSFNQGKKNSAVEYSLLPDRILLLLRYPRYLTIVENKYGEQSSILLGEVLKNGITTASGAILAVYKSINKEESNVNLLDQLRKSFSELVSNHYVMRCASPSEQRVPVFTISDLELFSLPELSLKRLSEMENGTNSAAEDGKIYWKTNFDRLHQDMRDEIMISAMGRRYDNNVAVLLESLLQLVYLRTEPWAPQSNPVPYLELRSYLDKSQNNAHLVQFLEQYFKIIEEETSSFIRRFGDGGSGSTFVNFVTAFKNLTACVIENLVEQRFGPKAARIFRLVRTKKYLDQEQIQKVAMIPDKEAKQLTYKLLQENFLQMIELKKAPSNTVNKNFYVFHVDLNQVARVVLEICYKAVYNTLTRADHEKKENIRLIEKQEKLNSVAECMRQQGTEESQIQDLIDEWITPPEKQLLESIQKFIDKLQMAELHVDQTIFIIQIYMFYEKCVIQDK